MQEDRIIGLDLIRILSYNAIVVFHAVLFYFYLPEMPYLEESFILNFYDTYARVFAFSGFTIVLLSSFLISFSNKFTRRLRFFGSLAIGWLTLCILMTDGSWVVWDVYSLILVATALFIALPKARYILGALGFVLLWIPFWEFTALKAYLSKDAQHVFGLAPCVGREISEWPILPWIGLVWFGCMIGIKSRQWYEAKALDKICLKEGMVWSVLLLASIPQIGGYFNIRIGPYFSCDAYRQPPQVFWSHMIWVLFLMRLSFHDRVRSFLYQRQWARSISQLAISQNFFLAYLLFYIYSAIVSSLLIYIKHLWPDVYAAFELPLCEFFGLTLIFQSELLTRYALRAGKVLKSWSRPYLKSLGSKIGVKVEEST